MLLSLAYLLNSNSVIYDKTINSEIILIEKTKTECIYIYKYTIENESYFDCYKSWSSYCSINPNINITYVSTNPSIHKVIGDPYIKVDWKIFMSISILSDSIIIVLIIQIIKLYNHIYIHNQFEEDYSII